MADDFKIPKEFSVEWLQSVHFKPALRGYNTAEVDSTIDFVVNNVVKIIDKYNEIRAEHIRFENQMKAQRSKLSQEDYERLIQDKRLTSVDEGEDYNPVYGSVSEIQNEAANEEIERLNNELRKRDARIESLMKDSGDNNPIAAKLLREADEARTAATAEKERADVLASELAEAKELIDQLQAASAEKDDTISSLRESVESMKTAESSADASTKAFGIIKNATDLAEATVAAAHSQAAEIVEEAKASAATTTATAEASAKEKLEAAEKMSRDVIEKAEVEATTRRREADADVAERQRACDQFESARAAALKEIEEIANALADLIEGGEVGERALANPRHGGGVAPNTGGDGE